MPTPWLTRLLQDRLLMVLLILVIPLLIVAPVDSSEWVALVHWQTLAALAGLMVLSRALDDSGYLTLAGRWLLTHLQGERRLALLLVLFAALLAAIVTNDVALFIMIPLTVSLRSAADLPIGRLVIFQALAVNAGSTFSPVGNPQNLYLWQFSQAGFGEFVLAMLPLGSALMLLLLAAIPLAFRARRLAVNQALPAPATQPGLLKLTLVLYPLFVVLMEFNQTLLAVAVLLAIFARWQRGVLRGVDWALLLVFLLMFVDLGLVAKLPWLQQALAPFTGTAESLLTTTIVVSQGLSNVPATLLLTHFSTDWITLAWGASVGGFGLAIGSLANLIALRIARLPGLWWDFHRWSLLMLVTGWLLAVVLR